MMARMNRSTVWLSGAVLVVLVWAVYAFAFPGMFHLDDWEYITHNPLIIGPHGLWSIWFSTQSKDYYPLTYSVFWLEYRLWGQAAAGYLAVNIALHSLNVVLLWQLLRRLKLNGAWLAALLFGVHPLNVVAVAWLSELKSLLAMALSLLVVFAALRFEETQRRRWYLAALGLFALALLSKSAVVTLPVALLLLAVWRHGLWRLAEFIRAIPFFALAVVFGLITIWFQSHHVLEGGSLRQLTLLQRAGDAACALWFYLGKAFCPVNLMLIYPHWVDPQPVFWQALAVAGWGLVAVLLWRLRQFGILVALGIYAVMLLPVLGFIDQGFYAFSLVSDHWQFSVSRRCWYCPRNS